MKVFHCDHCSQLLFFENVSCVQCGHKLGYVPEVADLVSLELSGEGLWRSPAAGVEDSTFRLCKNYTEENVCNWTVAPEDDSPYCRSCRLTRVIPDLGVPGHRVAWYRLEVAKRRLVYSLLCLGLPLAGKTEDPETGLMFKFMADPTTPGAPPVLTGHNDGIITVNIAEADDAVREKRRVQMHEPYRTLVGHFRHEVGHYYWDRLIMDSPWLERYRALFGDEREDYAAALQRHYDNGPPGAWQDHFVSAYASMHSWEDWAETWAHYLHMTDTLEIAAACGLTLRPHRGDEPTLKPDPAVVGCRPSNFDQMLERWGALTYVLNNLNRSLGLLDGYPFILSAPAVAKLRFVHELIGAASGAS